MGHMAQEGLCFTSLSFTNVYKSTSLHTVLLQIKSGKIITNQNTMQKPCHTE